jgi:hypothetical protein
MLDKKYGEGNAHTFTEIGGMPLPARAVIVDNSWCQLSDMETPETPMFEKSASALIP